MRVLNEGVANGDGGSFTAVRGAELVENIADMVLGSFGANEKLRGDFHVGQSLAEEFQNFPLPSGKIKRARR